jgi:hypothetical protein
MAIIKNLTIDKNTNYERTFIFYGVNNSYFNLTGFTANSEIKKDYSSANVEATFACDIQSANNKVILTLNHIQLANTKPGKYKYDIILTSSNNEKVKAVEGSVDIIGTITK